MGAIENDRHRPWLAYALEESLERSLLAPRDVIDYANPEVLVTQLPPSVISDLLARALAIGTFSPAQVLESAPPALLAEHLDPEVMWRCLKEAAERGGLSRKGDPRSTPARRWFASVLARALESQLITPADVLRFLPPNEFVADAPRPVLAELIKSALGRGSFDATLVLEHLTPEVISEDLETSLVWDCISEAAARHFELGSGGGKTDEVMTPAKAPAAVTAPVSTAAAAPAPAAASPVAARPIAKSIEKDKQAADRKVALGEKAAAVMAALSGASVTGKATLGSGPVPARATAAATAAPAPAPAPAAAAAAGAPPRRDAVEWSPADDLDVLDDQPLPFPLPR